MRFLRWEYLVCLLCLGAGQDLWAQDYHYAVARPMKINAKKLGRCFALATLRPKQPYYSSRAIDGQDFSLQNFMDYLEASRARKFDYVTGNEEALKKWILSQPDNSIDPLSLFQQSMRMNQRNIWASILTIHDILRNMARYKETVRYHYDGTNSEEASRFFNKLIDIRGDLTDRDPHLLGDHRGSWYRIWGMMLYRLMWEDDLPMQTFGAQCDAAEAARRQKGSVFHSWLSSLTKTIMPEIAGHAVEWSKLHKSYALDKRKSEINLVGSDSMEEMISMLWNDKKSHEKNPDFEREWQDCQSRNYLEFSK